MTHDLVSLAESHSAKNRQRSLTPKFIYFDLDDTLLDHKRAEAAALNDVHTRFDIFEDIKAQKLIDIYGTVNRKQWELYSKGEVSRKQMQRNRFELTLEKLKLDTSGYADIGTFYMRCYRDYWHWISGAREAFAAISRKFEVGILTNGFSETQKLKFKQFDLYGRVSHLVISEEVGVLKPHPRVFQHATELTGHNAGEILYIGDSFSSDILGASQFGWKTAWYTKEALPEEENKADFVFSDFKELYRYLSI